MSLNVTMEIKRSLGPEFATQLDNSLLKALLSNSY